MNTKEKMIELEESAEHRKRMNVIGQNGNDGLAYETTMTYEQEFINKFDVVDDKDINPLNKAAQRKATPVFSGVLKYFPNAIKEVSKCSQVGNDQHHPDKPLHWDMNKSKDEYDALTRHLIDHTIEPLDDDGVLHLTKVAWRALAGLERYLTNKQ